MWLFKLRACTSALAHSRLSTRAAGIVGGGCDCFWGSMGRCWSLEAVGGVLTGSLAVLADAGHLLSDVGSIGLALLLSRWRLVLPLARRDLWLSALGGSGRAGEWATPCCRRDRDRLWRRSVGSGIRPRSMGLGVLGLGLLGLARQRRRDRGPGSRREGGRQPGGGAAAFSAADALGSLGVVIAGAFVLVRWLVGRRSACQPGASPR